MGRTADGSLRRTTERPPMMREGGRRRFVRCGACRHRSTGRPVGLANLAVAAQSLVDYVRLAALCGLLRCEIAENPKGNRRRRFGRDIGRGSSRREAPRLVGDRSLPEKGFRVLGRSPNLNLGASSNPCQDECVRYRVQRFAEDGASRIPGRTMPRDNIRWVQTRRLLFRRVERRPLPRRRRAGG